MSHRDEVFPAIYGNLAPVSLSVMSAFSAVTSAEVLPRGGVFPARPAVVGEQTARNGKGHTRATRARCSSRRFGRDREIPGAL
eukprot:2477502-Prymnesium_polylepis.1